MHQYRGNDNGRGIVTGWEKHQHYHAGTNANRIKQKFLPILKQIHSNRAIATWH